MIQRGLVMDEGMTVLCCRLRPTAERPPWSRCEGASQEAPPSRLPLQTCMDPSTSLKTLVTAAPLQEGWRGPHAAWVPGTPVIWCVLGPPRFPTWGQDCRPSLSTKHQGPEGHVPGVIQAWPGRLPPARARLCPLLTALGIPPSAPSASQLCCHAGSRV